jgi:S-adenosylmethionine/arginine decarboxylase-like enzyme
MMYTEPLKTVNLSYMHLPEPDKTSQAGPWGWHLALDLYDCDLGLITSSDVIRDYVIELCNLINMRRFGDPIIVNFGDDPRVTGYSLVQLIETSNICGHFANESCSAYIDIFSCKYFDPELAARFTVDAFRAQKVSGVHITRD